MTFKDKVNRLIEKGVVHLEQIEAANSRIRINSLISFFVLNTDNQNDKRLKDIHLLTSLAVIAWHIADGGKYED